MSEQRTMSVKKIAWLAAAAGAVCAAAVSQASTTTDPSQKQLNQAVKAFLVDHGDLCLAKYTWPRDVTPEDQQANSNDALQLPVLERLGVVQSVEVSASTGATRRYSLTAKGRQYYLQKKHTVLGQHGAVEEHAADFCVAHLTLDKVVKWSPPEPVHDHLETVVRYTYHIKAADWMSEPAAQKVFPFVDRIIRGQGTLLMAATVQLHDGKWVPVLPGQ